MEIKAAVQTLGALAQETRLGIFRLLVEAGPSGMAAGEIGAELGLPPATLSFHLKELSRAALVTPKNEGRFIFYAANFSQMTDLLDFMMTNCCARDGNTAPCAPASACKPALKPATFVTLATSRSTQ